MSDLPPSDSTPADADPGAAPAAGEVQPSSTAEPSVDDGAPPSEEAVAPTAQEQGFLDGLPDEVKGHVKGLREEAAGYRVKAKQVETAYEPFRGVFEGVDDGTRDAVLQLAGTLIKDPENAGPKELLRVARALTGDRFDEVMKSLDEPQYLTAEQAKELYEKEQQAKEEERERTAAVEAVQKEAKELGYEDDTVEKSMLFFFAHRQTEGDLKAAHEKVEAFRKDIVDKFVAGQRERNGSFPPQTSATGEGPAGGLEGPKTFEEARRRTEARIAAAAGEVS